MLLLRLFNACAGFRKFPKRQKEMEVIFFVKKRKNASQCSAYRPICLLQVLSKILEKLIKNRLVHDLETSGFLHDAQFGFRENRSTESSIMADVTYVREEKAKGTYPVLVSLDKVDFDNVQWELIVDSL